MSVEDTLAALDRALAALKVIRAQPAPKAVQS